MKTVDSPDVKIVQPMASGGHPPMRPKDAGVLIIVRRDADEPRLLMGRRSSRHAFMPNTVVFPGGRVDRGDRYGPSADSLKTDVVDKLLARTHKRMTDARARAIALAAIRETFEETGVMLARPAAIPGTKSSDAWKGFAEKGILPALGELRLIARAITPPGRSRRFDARFFATFSDQIGGQVPVAEDELSEVQWLTFDEARATDLPRITGAILNHLQERLQTDPGLSKAATIPFHYMRNGRFVCDMI